MLRCVLQEVSDDTQYQHLLGRFYMLENLIEEYPAEFTVNDVDFCQNSDVTGSNGADGIPQDSSDYVDEPMASNYVDTRASPTQHERGLNDVYSRATAILNFCKRLLNHSHAKVEKFARRMFYITARLQRRCSVLFYRILAMLDDVELNVQISLRRRLLRLSDEKSTKPFDCELTAHDVISGEPSRTDDVNEGSDGEYGPSVVVKRASITTDTVIATDRAPLYTTPVASGCSSPRCVSPSLASEHEPQQPGAVAAREFHEPVAPPNTPSKSHLRRQTPVRKARQSRDLESDTSVPPSDISDNQAHVLNTSFVSTETTSTGCTDSRSVSPRSTDDASGNVKVVSDDDVSSVSMPSLHMMSPRSVGSDSHNAAVTISRRKSTGSNVPDTAGKPGSSVPDTASKPGSSVPDSAPKPVPVAQVSLNTHLEHYHNDDTVIQLANLHLEESSTDGDTGQLGEVSSRFPSLVPQLPAQSAAVLAQADRHRKLSFMREPEYDGGEAPVTRTPCTSAGTSCDVSHVAPARSCTGSAESLHSYAMQHEESCVQALDVIDGDDGMVNVNVSVSQSTDNISVVVTSTVVHDEQKNEPASSEHQKHKESRYCVY